MASWHPGTPRRSSPPSRLSGTLSRLRGFTGSRRPDGFAALSAFTVASLLTGASSIPRIREAFSFSRQRGRASADTGSPPTRPRANSSTAPSSSGNVTAAPGASGLTRVVRAGSDEWGSWSWVNVPRRRA